MLKPSLVFTFCLILSLGNGQDIFKGYEKLFTLPLQYTVHYTADTIHIDGKADEKTWLLVPWTADFVDIEGPGKPLPPFKTRIKMARDDKNLYVFAELEEPHIWATLTKHDAIIYQDNDFEVFIDTDGDTHNYFEIEINALNTIFDLFLSKPYRNGGTLLTTWNAEHLKTAVQINGTLNKPGDTDKGWTIEMSIPFASMRTSTYASPPSANTFWRINFSRVQWYTEISEGKYKKKTDASGKPLPENNWVWSPQGIINMHYPERWGYIRFAARNEKIDGSITALPPEEDLKRYLWLLYYKQKDYFHKHKVYAQTLLQLDFPPAVKTQDGNDCTFKLEATSKQFSCSVIKNGKELWLIDNNGRITRK